MNRKSYAKDMPFSRMLEDAVCLPLFDGGNVGVRRRQLEKIKGFSEIKVEKVKEAVRKCMV